MSKLPCCLIALGSVLAAQSTVFPLESVSVEGTSLSQAVVLELTGLKIGSPVDPPAMQAACKKLEETGLFDFIDFQYAPGPRKGYALTLALSDQAALADAIIDIPGVDASEAWKWLAGRFPPFNRKVPAGEVGQQFLAREIEQHLGGKQHIIPAMETEFVPHQRLIVSFQPETLPAVASMSFTGNRELTSDELTAILTKVANGQGYTDHRFRSYVELNVRPAYEEHGMYRVQFSAITTQPAGEASVHVTVSVEEGAKYTLGEVQLVGADLPANAMMKAAAFKPGAIANWTQIRNSIWEMEKPLKRTGYFEAVALPERVFDDNRHVLEVKIRVPKGPLYRFGELRINGLNPSTEAKARKLWTMLPGQPYDYQYPNDFFQEFSRTVDFRQFKKFSATRQQGPGNHVFDITLNFEPR